MNIAVIIPAAGRSTRFGRNDKLAQDLGGRSVLLRTVELFSKRDDVRSIIIAGPSDQTDAFNEFKEKFGPTLGFHGAMVVPGGVDARWESVRNALQHVPDDATHVAVHDAARPGASSELIDRVFAAAEMMPAVVPTVPIDATCKRISADAEEQTIEDDDAALADAILGDVGKTVVRSQRVIETIDRTNLHVAQTPQVFAADLLRRAYAQDDLSGATDDASLVERLGETVHAVSGEVRNFKITTPDDLKLMRAALNLKPPAERPTHKRF
jgi:2-C-methyl-D-erythritol 4-phosphate cytidylyltransferase